jgi:hypothetical protein
VQVLKVVVVAAGEVVFIVDRWSWDNIDVRRLQVGASMGVVAGDILACAILHGKAVIMAGLLKLSIVVIVVVIGFVGFENECCCTRCVSRGAIDPAYCPNAEGEYAVNPVFRVVFFFFAWGGFAS